MPILGPEWWRAWGWLVIIPLAIYLLYIAFLYRSQSRLLYLPAEALVATPDSIGLAYERITFEAADGVRLVGWYIPAEGRAPVLLFFHGNAGNISHRLGSIEQFHRMGLDVFIFDYRGYGESGGTPSEEGTYRDARAAWDYLVTERGVAPEEIVLFGRSLGGAVAAWLGEAEQPVAIILESTFTSIPDIAARYYPLAPVRYLSRSQYNTEERLSGITAPVLIVHSNEDELIPFDHALRLYEAARGPKELLEISGGHNDGFSLSAEIYEEGLRAFVERYASQ